MMFKKKLPDNEMDEKRFDILKKHLVFLCSLWGHKDPKFYYQLMYDIDKEALKIHHDFSKGFMTRYKEVVEKWKLDKQNEFVSAHISGLVLGMTLFKMKEEGLDEVLSILERNGDMMMTVRTKAKKSENEANPD